MSYLKQKPGSIEDAITKMSSKVLESDYQDKFKKELEKTGKGIGSMTPAEKKAFFNKIDKMHSAKDENAPTDADMQRLKKMGMKKEEVELSEKASMAKMYTKKASNGDVEVFYRGRTKYGNDKKIGYYHKQGSKFVAYHDNSDDKDDFTQSDTYNDERSAQMTILQTAAKERVITEEVYIDETHMGQTAKANQSQKDAKGEKEVIKPMRETILDMWKEAAEKKIEKKKDATPPVDNTDEEPKKEEPKKEEESVDKAKAEVEKAKDEVQILKQKIETEKTKQVQQQVNPETGEPLLKVGVAYKHLKDKMKKEEAVTNAEKKKEEEQNKNKKTTDTGEKPSEIETKPEIKYAN